MAATRLWITWGGLACFIAMIFTGLRDLARYRSRVTAVPIVLGLLVVVALVLLLFLPKG